jgi:L-ascorbate 6-phosphate lactonase
MMATVSSRSIEPPPGTVRVRWLGQAGMVVGAGQGSVAIDPWFTDHELRLHAQPRLDDLPGDLRWLLATHGHEDHLDLPALPGLVQRFPNLTVVVPTPLRAEVQAAAPQLDVRGVQPGERLGDDRVRIDVVPAWHGVTVGDGYSQGPAGEMTPHVGYVVRLGGVTLYHAGDTISSAGLIEAVRPYRVDVAMLPTNGRDAGREAAGILGNLDAIEAAELAAAIGARIAIPMHYDMVRGNTAPAGDLANAVARLGLPITVVVPSRAQPIDLYLGVAS